MVDYMLGAYWNSRDCTPETLSAQLEQLTKGLGAIDPRFAEWGADRGECVARVGGAPGSFDEFVHRSEPEKLVSCTVCPLVGDRLVGSLMCIVGSVGDYGANRMLFRFDCDLGVAADTGRAMVGLFVSVTAPEWSAMAPWDWFVPASTGATNKFGWIHYERQDGAMLAGVGADPRSLGDGVVVATTPTTFDPSDPAQAQLVVSVAQEMASRGFLKVGRGGRHLG